VDIALRFPVSYEQAKAEFRVFLMVPAYPGCPGTKAVKRLLLFPVSYDGPQNKAKTKSTCGCCSY